MNFHHYLFGCLGIRCHHVGGLKPCSLILIVEGVKQVFQECRENLKDVLGKE